MYTLQNDQSKSISHPSPSIVRKILFLFLVMRTFKIYSQQINNRCFLVAELCLFVIPWTIARQAPLSMGFSWQEHWSGLPCPPPGDLPNPGNDPRSPTLHTDSLLSEPPGKPPSLIMFLSVSTKLCLSLFSFLLLSNVMLQTLENVLFHAQGAQWIKCPHPTRTVCELSSVKVPHETRVCASGATGTGC